MESNHGISVEVKWIGIRHPMKKKGKIPCIPKTLMSMKRRIARKTDRETHFNSLHLHMSGDKKDFSSKRQLQMPLCMLVSYTDNLCKQLGPRPELTKCRS